MPHDKITTTQLSASLAKIKRKEVLRNKIELLRKCSDITPEVRLEIFTKAVFAAKDGKVVEAILEEAVCTEKVWRNVDPMTAARCLGKWRVKIAQLLGMSDEEIISKGKSVPGNIKLDSAQKVAFSYGAFCAAEPVCEEVEALPNTCEIPILKAGIEVKSYPQAVLGVAYWNMLSSHVQKLQATSLTQKRADILSNANAEKSRFEILVIQLKCKASPGASAGRSSAGEEFDRVLAAFIGTQKPPEVV